jgi:prepilin-type N-terminal cleavage/methylation domain-containing protein
MNFRSPSTRGFTLIELLAVMAIVIVMLGLLVSSLAGFGSTAGRRGAVNTTMNLIEQARVAALESGASVQVIFWRRSFPDYDSIMVRRERTDSDNPTAGTSGASTYVNLTDWVKLPKGIIFRGITSSITGQTAPTGFNAGLASSPALDRLSFLQYNSMGVVEQPTNNLNLYLSEGVRDTNGAEAAIPSGQNAAGSYLEKIAIARFTGRPRLEITVKPTN